MLNSDKIIVVETEYVLILVFSVEIEHGQFFLVSFLLFCSVPHDLEFVYYWNTVLAQLFLNIFILLI